ncbi:MAG: helix-hairpin-helix domain-containing protein [Candidatus Omnitrophica bacterium]|nr:helix-hairpin-helix domain-containing protein [Candidatus Omnitrophota bacterium]
MEDSSSEERKVIVFVFALFIFGVGISLFNKNKVIDGAQALLIAPQANIGVRNYIPENNSNLKKELVPINSAGLDSLCTLTGIGPIIARRIIDYRKNNGPFKTKEEILCIKGIGPKKFEKIKDLILLE